METAMAKAVSQGRVDEAVLNLLDANIVVSKPTVRNRLLVYVFFMFLFEVVVNTKCQIQSMMEPQ